MVNIVGKRQIKGHPLREERRERALARQADSITNPADQLAILDLRLGKNVGARRERAMLVHRMSN